MAKKKVEDVLTEEIKGAKEEINKPKTISEKIKEQEEKKQQVAQTEDNKTDKLNPIVKLAMAFEAGNINVAIDDELQQQVRTSSKEEQYEAISINPLYCKFIPNLHVDIQSDLISRDIMFALLIKEIDESLKDVVISAATTIINHKLNQASQYIYNCECNHNHNTFQQPFTGVLDTVDVTYDVYRTKWKVSYGFTAYIDNLSEISDICPLVNGDFNIKFTEINQVCLYKESDRLTELSEKEQAAVINKSQNGIIMNI